MDFLRILRHNSKDMCGRLAWVTAEIEETLEAGNL